MLQPWGAANTFFDIGSVFTVNGLAPQQSFSKPASGRFVPRTRSSKRPGSDRMGSSENPAPRSQNVASPGAPVSMPVTSIVTTTATTSVQASGVPPMAKPLSNFNGELSVTKDSIDSVAMRLADSLDIGVRLPKEKSDNAAAILGGDRHRRRRKEDESGGAVSQNSPPGSLFDLEATAFPPLPAGAILQAVSVETEAMGQTHWGENRLSDVVKGTAKHKASSSSSSSINNNHNINGSPAQPPPAVATADQSTQQSDPPVEKRCKSVDGGSSPTAPAADTSCDANATILTPPPSPIKCVVIPKCATADKATKTDDILLNGEPERQEKPAATPKPSTNNAATMTSSVPVDPEHSDLPPRLSYAQVAQHAKEKAERLTCEKTILNEADKDSKKEGSCSRDSKREPSDKVSDRKEEGFREVTSRAASRTGSRQGGGERESRGGRRREPPPRDSSRRDTPRRDAK